MVWTDWLRLILALTFTGLSLYYNYDLTQKVINWLGVNKRFGYQFELISWVLVLISTCLLGIATNRKHVLEVLSIGVFMGCLYFLQNLIFKG